MTSYRLPRQHARSTKRPSKLQLLKIIGKTKSVTYRFYFFVGKLPKFFNLLESIRKSYLVKIWSSHLLDNLSNCLMNLKNSGDSTGFNPWPLRCRCSALTNWAMKSHSGEQVNLLGSWFPVKGMSYERMLYAVRCLKSSEDMILALAGQFKQLSHEPEKFRWLNGIRTHDLCDAGAVL